MGGQDRYTCIFLFLVMMSSIVCQQVRGLQSKTLLISLDGFRWDYIGKADTPNIDKLIAQGSHVKQVKNAFATLTMPNHWTIVTGKYEEEHGIIANKFYDADLNDTYSFSRDSKWYNNTEPVWITAEKEGKTTGSYMWAGNQALYDGMGPTKVVPFKYNLELQDGIDTVVDWFANDDLTFACLYTDQPDKDGHRYGPDSEQIIARIMDIDTLLGGLITKFEELGLTDRVNIIIASDHGMTNVSNANSIDLSKYINFTEEIAWNYLSAVGLINPKPGMLDQVYNKLKQAAENNEPHMKVYKKAEIPDSLRYKNHKRITDIVIVPDNGWLLKRSGYTVSLKGNHGFNNSIDDMMTTLIARGPNFKCGHKQDMIRSVDIYPLLCHLLNLTTCHESDGNLQHTSDLLSNQNCLPRTQTSTTTGSTTTGSTTTGSTTTGSTTTDSASSNTKPLLGLIFTAIFSIFYQ